MNCLNCQNIITTRDAKKFCSRSCSATHNNKLKDRKPWTIDQRKNLSVIRKRMLENGTIKNTLPLRKNKKWTVEQRTAFSQKKKQLILSGNNPAPPPRKRTNSVSYKKARQCFVCNIIFSGSLNVCKDCRKQTEESRSCIVCSAQYVIPRISKRKFCSDKCYRLRQSQLMSERLKKYNYRYQLKGKDSYLERSFDLWLRERGLKPGLHGYMREIHFYNPKTKKHGYCDFIFPKLKLVIELDGTTHRKTILQDSLRDEFLTERGWHVLRISHREYTKKIKYNEVCKKLKLGTTGGT